jgi:hypothetical protein
LPRVCKQAIKKTGERLSLPGSSSTFSNDVARLPATAAAAAITAVAVPADTASAPATTPGASPASTASTESAPTATAASATPALSRWPRFVHYDVAAHEIVTIQSLDGALGLVVAIDLDKPEPAWLARKTVAHQGNVCGSNSRLSK